MVALRQPEKPLAQHGYARLTVEIVAGQSAVTSASSATPMKLLTPRARGQSVWACTSSFGGGLVAGDETRLALQLRENARCYLGTQASTKIYRNPGLQSCSHHTEARLAENSLLVFAPDPVQAFAGSSYSQRQEFHLAENSSLVLLDWFSSGRVARGERWQFSRFQSRNEVFLAGERFFLDSLLLDATNPLLTSSHVTGRFNCFAMLLMLGTDLQTASQNLLSHIATQPVKRTAPLVVSASPIRNGVLLRLAAESVELAAKELHGHLQFLPALLGDDPWARKW
jgi:urease accessory protein